MIRSDSHDPALANRPAWSIRGGWRKIVVQLGLAQGWGATTCILLLAAEQLECEWHQNPISLVSSDTHALLGACHRLVQQLWGLAAGLVCIQSPSVVELRMEVVMAWLRGQQGRIGPGRGAG
jgi:hypothetical protein